MHHSVIWNLAKISFQNNEASPWSLTEVKNVFTTYGNQILLQSRIGLYQLECVQNKFFFPSAVFV